MLQAVHLFLGRDYPSSHLLEACHGRFQQYSLSWSRRVAGEIQSWL